MCVPPIFLISGHVFQTIFGMNHCTIGALVRIVAVAVKGALYKRTTCKCTNGRLTSIPFINFTQTHAIQLQNNRFYPLALICNLIEFRHFKMSSTYSSPPLSGVEPKKENTFKSWLHRSSTVLRFQLLQYMPTFCT